MAQDRAVQDRTAQDGTEEDRVRAGVTGGRAIDPLLAIRREGAPPRPKRFYEAAGVGERGDGFALLLDGKPARTPARNALILPTRAAALALAREWDAQGPTIDPATMPITRIVNSTIDGVAAQMAAAFDETLGYFASDLLYYRAGEPAALVDAQAEAWDPVLRAYEDTLGARFHLAEGVMFVAQPAATLARLAEAARAFVEGAEGGGRAAPFRLAAFNVATTLMGSGLLALALMEGRLSAGEAWGAAHVDERFQEERWGVDAEAWARREQRGRELDAAALLARAVG